MSEKLKPCPFCGKEAGKDWNGEEMCIYCPDGCVEFFNNDEKENIKNWNKRTQPTITVEDIVNCLDSEVQYMEGYGIREISISDLAEKILNLIKGEV